jgi:hypothetical protein
VPQLTIVFGGLLIALGLVPYFAAVAGMLGSRASVTALIPAVAGVLLVLLGALARRPGARKHAMHGAAMVALLGFLAPVGRLAGVAAKGTLSLNAAVVSQVLMAVLCGVFLVLCVRSFIAARRARDGVA